MSLWFGGYAALWDRVDRAGDLFRAGAFGGPAPVPLLCGHRGQPVGAIEVIEEDGRGLRVTASVADRAVAARVRDGTLTGLSVSYRPLDVARGRARELRRVRLVEVSLVRVPMQPLARVDTVF